MTKRWTMEMFQNKLDEKYHGEYQVLPNQTYKNQTTSLYFYHTKCKNNIQMIPSNLLRGHKCNICFGTHKYTNEDIDYKIKKYLGEDFRLVGNYKNWNIPIKIEHISKNHNFNILVKALQKGVHCKECYRKSKTKPQEQIEKELYNKLGNEYLVIGKYTSGKKSISILHTKCGKVYNPIVHSVLSSSNKCPTCKESSGEKMTREYLNKYNVQYVPQKKFKELKDIKQLSYDFYLPKYNTLIEYQGKQHYKSINIKGLGMTNLKKQQYHDKLKRDYALNNGIYLLQIPYKVNSTIKIDKYLTKCLSIIRNTKLSKYTIQKYLDNYINSLII